MKKLILIVLFAGLIIGAESQGSGPEESAYDFYRRKYPSILKSDSMKNLEEAQKIMKNALKDPSNSNDIWFLEGRLGEIASILSEKYASLPQMIESLKIDVQSAKETLDRRIAETTEVFEKIQKLENELGVDSDSSLEILQKMNFLMIEYRQKEKKADTVKCGYQEECLKLQGLKDRLASQQQ